jgi:pimeloyl-ACP methyl ester carboxylesterase
MRGRSRALLAILVFAAALLVPSTVRAQVRPGACVSGVLPHGALSLICVPDTGWNGDLVVYAHGYVAPGLPLDFYQTSLPDGTALPALLQSLGYAFATTSYRQNGLAILEGADDIRELVAAFEVSHPVPARTYIAGLSEGGLVATLLAERSPNLFTGAMASCAPIGSFLGQLEYIGDFRVLFDYFYPGVLPGSPIRIPTAVMLNWQSHYAPAIQRALAARPARTLELLRTAKAPFDPSKPETAANTVVDLLWYNVFATNDAVAKLHGNPFGNRLKWYSGSSNDLLLNLRVRRFTASPVARNAVRAYETNGQTGIPLVTLHTTSDDVVPFLHELAYVAKADPVGRGKFLPVPVLRYGHCNFTTNEVLGAFLLMVKQP